MTAVPAPTIDNQRAPWVDMRPEDAAVQAFWDDGRTATFWGRAPVTVIVGDLWVTATAGERKMVRVADGDDPRRATEADVLGVTSDENVSHRD